MSKCEPCVFGYRMLTLTTLFSLRELYSRLRKSNEGSRFCPLGFNLAVARLGGRDQRRHQGARRRGHFVNCAFERCSIRLRRRIEAAELAYELQRRVFDFP